jgi:hypothetical protein
MIKLTLFITLLLLPSASSELTAKMEQNERDAIRLIHSELHPNRRVLEMATRLLDQVRNQLRGKRSQGLKCSHILLDGIQEDLPAIKKAGKARIVLAEWIEVRASGESHVNIIFKIKLDNAKYSDPVSVGLWFDKSKCKSLQVGRAFID